MVPSPPERSGSIASNVLPYSLINDSFFVVEDIDPLLTDSFSIRVVVNGIEGKEAHFPEDNNTVIWEDAGKKLTLVVHTPQRDFFELHNKEPFTISEFECYIDDVKMNITS